MGISEYSLRNSGVKTMNRLSKWDIKRKEEKPNNLKKKEKKKRIWLERGSYSEPSEKANYHCALRNRCTRKTAKATSARKETEERKSS